MKNPLSIAAMAISILVLGLLAFGLAAEDEANTLSGEELTAFIQSNLQEFLGDDSERQTIAHANLVKYGPSSLPALKARALNSDADNLLNAEQISRLQAVVYDIRGWQLHPLRLSSILKMEHRNQLTGLIHIRDMKSADKLFQDTETVTRDLDFDQEEILIVMPEKKLQSIQIKSFTFNEEEETWSLVLYYSQQFGCGMTSLEETAAVFVLHTKGYPVTVQAVQGLDVVLEK